VLRSHRRRHRPRAKERTLQDGVDHGVPVGLAEFRDACVAREAGIVDQDVDAAEGFECSLHQAFHVGGVRHVSGDADGREAAALQRGAAVGGGLRVDIRDDDARAFLGQRARGFGADAAARAGDDRDLVRQSELHVPPQSEQFVVVLADVRCGPGLARGRAAEARRR